MHVNKQASKQCAHDWRRGLVYFSDFERYKFSSEQLITSKYNYCRSI